MQSANYPGYSQAEVDVATLLMVTYKTSYIHHLNQQLSTAAACDPQRFTRELGELKSEKRRDVYDNVEDNPDGATRKPKGEAAFWLSLARWVIAQRYDPETYIRRQFNVLAVGSKPPAKEAMKSDRAVTNYLCGHEIMCEKIGIAFGCNQHTFEVQFAKCMYSTLHPTSEEAWMRVLDDYEAQLSALFRYLMALSIFRDPKTQGKAPFQALLHKYKIAAVVQYMGDAEAYEKMMKVIIPANFRAYADSIYRVYYDQVKRRIP